MSEIMEAGVGLGIRNPKEKTTESIPDDEREKTDRRLSHIFDGVKNFREDPSEVIPGEIYYVGSIKCQRVPVSEASFCAKCGDLLGSQYGVVEYGNVDGPFYCTPDHLQEAKGISVV